MSDNLFFVDAHEGAPELQSEPGDIIYFVREGEDVPALVVRIEGNRIYFTNGPTLQ